MGPLQRFFRDPFLVRNMTYGVEDSLVSTTGLLVGVYGAGMPIPVILVTGVILILVEATSMAYGAFLSEESFLVTAKQAYTLMQVLSYGLVMFVSYAVAGLVPMAPFYFHWPEPHLCAIGLAMIALFVLVLAIHKNPQKAFLMTLMGTALMIVSVYVGKFLQQRDQKQDV